MTLDAAEVAQITEIAQRVAAEAIRNVARGTGGANIPVPVVRPATVSGDASIGGETQVRADGDLNTVPAVNATGLFVGSGDRVLVSWLPPLGVYVTSVLSGNNAGSWNPNFVGSGVSNANTVSTGAWTRAGRRVHAKGRAVLHTGGTWGSALQLAGLPFPIGSDNMGLTGGPSIGHFYGSDVSAGFNYPGIWVVEQGAAQGTLWYFGGNPVNLGTWSASFPFGQGDGDYLTVDIVYDTDA